MHLTGYGTVIQLHLKTTEPQSYISSKKQMTKLKTMVQKNTFKKI